MTPVCRSRALLLLATIFVALSLFSSAMFAATVSTTAHPEARIDKQVNNAKRVTLTVPLLTWVVSTPTHPCSACAWCCAAARTRSARCGASSTSSRTSAPRIFISG